MTRRPLTSQQEKILTFVEEYAGKHGFPPTFREIGEAVGVTNINAVRGHLLALEKKGYISKTPEKARSIQVLESPSKLSRLKRKLHRVLRTDDGVFHQVVLGLAWTTWRKTPYLINKTKDRMDRALVEQAAEHGWEILHKEIKPDHIALIVKTWPNHSPEQTVRRFQSAGRAVKRRHPEAFRGRRLWGRGYVATTSLDLLEELTAQLLENQGMK